MGNIFFQPHNMDNKCAQVKLLLGLGISGEKDVRVSKKNDEVLEKGNNIFVSTVVGNHIAVTLDAGSFDSYMWSTYFEILPTACPKHVNNFKEACSAKHLIKFWDRGMLNHFLQGKKQCPSFYNETGEKNLKWLDLSSHCELNCGKAMSALVHHRCWEKAYIQMATVYNYNTLAFNTGLQHCGVWNPFANCVTNITEEAKNNQDRDILLSCPANKGFFVWNSPKGIRNLIFRPRHMEKKCAYVELMNVEEGVHISKESNLVQKKGNNKFASIIADIDIVVTLDANLFDSDRWSIYFKIHAIECPTFACSDFTRKHCRTDDKCKWNRNKKECVRNCRKYKKKQQCEKNNQMCQWVKRKCRLRNKKN